MCMPVSRLRERRTETRSVKTPKTLCLSHSREFWQIHHLNINESSNDMIWQNSSRDWGSPSDAIQIGQHVYNYTEWRSFETQ